MKKLFLFISILLVGRIYSATYYVSTSGSNLNSGSKDFPWKTLTYSASSNSPVVAGDIVYVKAGNYGAENVTFQKSGTPDKPITFEGYRATPGGAMTIIVDSYVPYSSFSTTEMPTYDGGNRATGIAFNCENQRNLIIKNFQIKNYAYGVIAGSTSQTNADNITFGNINMMSLGDVNSSYSGVGFSLGSMGVKFANRNTITNCLVVNACAEGFDINGDNNKVSGCKVYCNDNTTNDASTDYYIIVCGSYNTIAGCYIERAPGLYARGHGYSIKSNAEQVVDKGLSLPVISPQYNQVINCTAKNMGESFCVRHRLTKNNRFYHCTATGTYTGTYLGDSGEGTGIVIRDGASNNIFDGCITDNCSSGISFSDSVEDGDTGTSPPGHPGNNNLITNCEFNNCYLGIEFSDETVQSDAGYNVISNSTFVNCDYLHYAGRHCVNMVYKNNTYSGCRGYFAGNKYTSDITATQFNGCTFQSVKTVSGLEQTNFLLNK